MEQSSRNFRPSSSYRKVQAIFVSSNRYFRENSRWVPLNKYKFAVPKPHTEFYKRSLSRSRNVFWNSLTLEVRQLTSLYVFKGKLKSLNLEICNIFTWSLFKACFLLLLLQYLNKIHCTMYKITLPYLCDVGKWFQTTDFLWLSILCVKTMYLAIKKQVPCILCHQKVLWKTQCYLMYTYDSLCF